MDNNNKLRKSDVVRIDHALDILASFARSRGAYLLLDDEDDGHGSRLYYQGRRQGKNLFTLKFKVNPNLDLKLPPGWENKPISRPTAGGVRSIKNISKADFIKTLSWFSRLQWIHGDPTFTPRLVNKGKNYLPKNIPQLPANIHPSWTQEGRNPTGLPLGRSGQGPFLRRNEGSNMHVKNTNTFLAHHHPRAMLHHNIIKEVARRRAIRSQHARNLSAHFTKMGPVLGELVHAPRAHIVSSFPGGTVYRAAFNNFHERAASGSPPASSPAKRPLLHTSSARLSKRQR